MSGLTATQKTPDIQKETIGVINSLRRVQATTHEMEDHMTKHNMFSSDNSKDFNDGDGTQAGEPFIVGIHKTSFWFHNI